MQIFKIKKKQNSHKARGYLRHTETEQAIVSPETVKFDYQLRFFQAIYTERAVTNIETKLSCTERECPLYLMTSKDNVECLLSTFPIWLLLSISCLSTLHLPRQCDFKQASEARDALRHPLVLMGCRVSQSLR